MAFRHLCRCYVCDRQFIPRTMAHINGIENEVKRDIATQRRENNNLGPLDIDNQTRLCINCNRLILDEIAILERDPNCTRLNVLTQTESRTCLFCNAENGIERLSMDCKANIFMQLNIFVPTNVRACPHHLDDKGFIPPPLHLGLRWINRPYRLRGQELQSFLQSLRNVARSMTRIEDENSFTDDEFAAICPLSKEQFQELFSWCDKVPREGGYRYISKRDLMIFLCKLRQGLSDEFLCSMFHCSSRQATSMIIATVRQSLLQRFVPQNIGLDSITRERYIQDHVTDFSNELYNPEPNIPRVIACIDGSYLYVPKSSNFRSLRQTFCFHKSRHLVKPVLIVAPDGYILDIQGPYFSDHSNNDAALLRNEFEKDAERMRTWLQEDDIIIVDRGYRDATALLTNLGIRWKMPSLLQQGERQLNTMEANASRLVTKSRWVVEVRNGHLKSIFKFFQQMIPIQHVPHLGDFCRIAGAIINRYHPTITMEGATVERAREFRHKAAQPNAVQALVVNQNLATRNAQRWVHLDAIELLDFPPLTLEYLKEVVTGVYQIKLAKSYVQDKLQRDQNEEFHLEMLQGEDRLPQPGLMRVRVFSRFRNATKYMLWISYEPTNEIEANVPNDDSPVHGYYCTCKSGARTLGTCAHIASVLWFMGYARHQRFIRYPSTRLLQSLHDAADRAQPRDLNV